MALALTETTIFGPSILTTTATDSVSTSVALKESSGVSVQPAAEEVLLGYDWTFGSSTGGTILVQVSDDGGVTWRTDPDRQIALPAANDNDHIVLRPFLPHETHVRFQAAAATSAVGTSLTLTAQLGGGARKATT